MSNSTAGVRTNPSYGKNDLWRRRTSRLFLCLVTVGLVLANASRAHAGSVVTIVLKDGTVIDGEIVLRTKTMLRLRTVHGERKYRLKNIEQIITPDSDPTSLGAGFDQLPSEVQQILDSRALYSLGQLGPVIERLTPLVNPRGNRTNQMLIRWLLIEAHQRLGHFAEARKHLDFAAEHGEPKDKMRADAHLQIFADNPDYDLRLIGSKRARFFLDDEMLVAGKKPGALAAASMMRAALEEYCDQILLSEKASVQAFARTLNQSLADTLRALDDPDRTGKATRALPYLDDLKDVENSLYRVQAVLPGYADAYELNMVRTETELMLEVIEQLFQRALAANPENTTPAFDRATGRLTTAGREQWRELCEDFRTQTEPTVQLTEYLLEKVQRYPAALRNLHKIYEERLGRLKQMRQLASKRKERSHV